MFNIVVVVDIGIVVVVDNEMESVTLTDSGTFVFDTGTVSMMFDVDWTAGDVSTTDGIVLVVVCFVNVVAGVGAAGDVVVIVVARVGVVGGDEVLDGT